MKSKVDYSLIASMLVMIAFILLTIRLEYFVAQFLPLVIASLGFSLAAWALIGRLLRKDTSSGTSVNSNEAGGGEEGRESWLAYGWQRYMIMIAWLGGLYGAFYLFGLIYSVPVFTLPFMIWQGTRWWVAVIYTIVVTLFLYVLFTVALEVYPYKGLLFTS